MLGLVLLAALQDPPIGWNDPAVPSAKLDPHKGCDVETITPKGKGGGTFDGTVRQIARAGADSMRISPEAKRILVKQGKKVALWKDGAWTEFGEFDAHVVDERVKTLVAFRESFRIHALAEGGSKTVASEAKTAHRMVMSGPKRSVLIQRSAESPDLLLPDWSRAIVQGVKTTLAAITHVEVNSQGDLVWTDGTRVEIYRFRSGPGAVHGLCTSWCPRIYRRIPERSEPFFSLRLRSLRFYSGGSARFRLVHCRP